MGYGYENTGCVQTMYANRISYFYDFHGPIHEHRHSVPIESGGCDVCIVNGSSITLHPGVSVAFGKLVMLTEGGEGGTVACKAFSKNADGYPFRRCWG